MQPDAKEHRPQIYLGAYALCFDALNRLLLCRLSEGCVEAGSWTLPGGGVHWGEPPEHAVVREFLEETGLEASAVGLVRGVFSEVYPQTEERSGAPVHHVGLLYSVGKATGELRSETAGTTDHCAWFTREEAKTLRITSLGRFALDIAWPKTGSSPRIEESEALTD